jgi:hypothetical protein
MKFKYLSSVFILIILLSVAGCKDELTNPVPRFTGAVHGSIWLINENGTLPTDRSGVTVSVEGTLLSCQTDSNGIYSLSGIDVGQNTLVFNKTGYGSMKVDVEIQKNNNVEYNYINLCELPSFRIQNLTIDSDTLSFNFTLNVYSSKIFIRDQGFVIYAYSDNSVSSDRNKYSVSFSYFIPANSNYSHYQFNASEFLRYGFQKGQKVYFTAYGASILFSGYWDRRIQKTIFTCLSDLPSNVVSFTLPLSEGYGK